MEGWIDTLLQELLLGSSWVKGLLIKHFPSNPVSKEALSSSFYGYNLRFPCHFPQAFLSRQVVWSLHHPWAQWQCCLSARREEREMPAREVPPPLGRADNGTEVRALQGMLMPATQPALAAFFRHTRIELYLYVVRWIRARILSSSGEQTLPSGNVLGKFQQEEGHRWNIPCA